MHIKTDVYLLIKRPSKLSLTVLNKFNSIIGYANENMVDVTGSSWGNIFYWENDTWVKVQRYLSRSFLRLQINSFCNTIYRLSCRLYFQVFISCINPRKTTNSGIFSTTLKIYLKVKHQDCPEQFISIK